MNSFEKQYNEVLKKLQDNKRVSMLKVIRVYCLQCCGYQTNEVDLCESADSCVLWPFRHGNRPKAMRLTRNTPNAPKVP